MDINHEATIGLLTETQSALYFRDLLDADSRATLDPSLSPSKNSPHKNRSKERPRLTTINLMSISSY